MTGQPARGDDLEELRGELEQLDVVELDERAELFERCHAALVAELNTLEEVT